MTSHTDDAELCSILASVVMVDRLPDTVEQNLRGNSSQIVVAVLVSKYMKFL